MTTHGKTGSRAYVSWNMMRNRCSNPKSNRYHLYGGRGIKVCDRWSKFENFYEDMGDRPEGMSLEREDNDGDYEPGNCKWSTPLEQARNTRNAKLHTFDDITDTQAGWARRQGISPATITKRVTRGWSVQEAVFGRQSSLGPSLTAPGQ